MLASLLQVFSTGLGLAGYYALVAVGFALIFATLRIFHVAHGTVFIIAGYTFFGLHRLLGIDVFLSAAAGVAAPRSPDWRSTRSSMARCCGAAVACSACSSPRSAQR